MTTKTLKYLFTLSNGEKIDIRNLKLPASLWSCGERRGGNLTFKWDEVKPISFEDAVNLNKFYHSFEWLIGHHPQNGLKFCIPLKKNIAFTNEGIKEIEEIQNSEDFWSFCIN